MNRAQLLLLIVSALLAGCATSPTGRKQLMLVSEDSAIQSSAQAYVQQVGQLQKGYNPEAAVSLWRKMNGLSKSNPPQFLSTHPNPENREKALAALVQQMEVFYQPEATHPVYALAGQPELN